MPRVDAYQGDQVRTQPLPNMRHTVVRPPEDFRAMASFGEELTRVAPVVSQIYQEQQRKANETATITAKRQFNDLYRMMALSGPENRGANGNKGLLTMQGIEAHDKQESNFQEWKTQADMIVGTAKNPEQKLLFEQMRDNEAARYFEQGMQHSSIEYGKYRIGEQAATLASTAQTAAAAAGTPDAQTIIDNQLDTQRQILEVSGKEKGKSRAEIDADIAALRSTTHAAVISHLLDMRQDQAAQAYYDKVALNTPEHPTELLEKDAYGIRTKLQVNSTEGEGLRVGNAIFADMGPQKPGDPVKTFEMAQEARKRASTPQAGERAVQQLKTLELEFEGQHQNLQVAIQGSLWDSFDKGVPLDELMATQAWTNADGTLKRDLHQAYNNREQDRINKLRSDHNYARSLLGEPIEDLNRREAIKEYNAAPAFYNLVNDIPGLVDMDQATLNGYIGVLSRGQFAQVKNLWSQVHGNVAASAAATVDRDRFINALVTNGNMPFAAKPTTKEEKDQVNQVWIAVENRLQAEQLALAKGSGQKVVLTGAQQDAIIADVIGKKAILPGGYFTDPRPIVQAALTRDQIGQARIPYPDIPVNVRRRFHDYIRSLPTKAGTVETRSLLGGEIDRMFTPVMELAAGAAVSGATDDEVNKILAEGVGKYRLPAAPTPAQPARGRTTYGPPTTPAAPSPRPSAAIPGRAGAPVAPPAAPSTTPSAAIPGRAGAADKK